MKRFLVTGVFALLVAAQPLAVEATTISLNWDTCTGPIQKTVAPGTVATAWISVIGHDQPHSGYEFRLSVADADGALPDAWRFDAGGCQGPEFIVITHLVVNAVSKMCPTFQGGLASTQVKSFGPATPDLGLPPTTGVAHLRNEYPAGNNTQINPTQRYMLGAIFFDHTYSVAGEATDGESCGGVERPMCLTLLPESTRWFAVDGRVVPFTIGNGTLTVNGGACGAVPAVSSTWGQIKSQYRR